MSTGPLLVSTESVSSGTIAEVVYSNSGFVYAQREALLSDTEIHPAALLSEALEWYSGQRINGGFSQFLYNSRTNVARFDRVPLAMHSVGAVQHLEHFNRMMEETEQLAQSRLRRFFKSSYFGRNAERDLLNQGDYEFEALLETENLTQLNGQWLTRHPDLQSAPACEFAERVAQLAAILIKDLPARQAASLAAEPRFMKLIRMLSTAAGHKYLHTTAGDPMYQFKGKHTLGWHFFTDQGHFVMVDLKTKASMIEYPSSRLVATIKAEGVE